jgi:hypothetical protein
MSLLGVASSAGIMTNALNSLIAGKVTIGVAGRLNTLSSSLQSFIDGQATIGVAALLETTTFTAQELRNRIGKEGAIGLLIGLCINRKS